MSAGVQHERLETGNELLAKAAVSPGQRMSPPMPGQVCTSRASPLCCSRAALKHARMRAAGSCMPTVPWPLVAGDAGCGRQQAQQGAGQLALSARSYPSVVGHTAAQQAGDFTRPHLFFSLLTRGELWLLLQAAKLLSCYIRSCQLDSVQNKCARVGAAAAQPAAPLSRSRRLSSRGGARIVLQYCLAATAPVRVLQHY